MERQRKPSQESSAQKPKTMLEHRREFTRRYEHIRIPELNTSWKDEGGEDRIGRVYRYSTLSDYSPEEANSLSKFVLKARQSGFTVIDKADYPFADTTIHQFTLEGKLLSSPA